MKDTVTAAYAEGQFSPHQIMYTHSHAMIVGQPSDLASVSRIWRVYEGQKAFTYKNASQRLR